MTWHSFFDMSTMQHRHLVFTYAGVWIVQLSYLGWILKNWLQTKSPRR
jgi:hypothetical protein